MLTVQLHNRKAALIDNLDTLISQGHCTSVSSPMRNVVLRSEKVYIRKILTGTADSS